jgi:hypothetical protein
MLHTRSNGRKKAEALEDLLPAFRATALPWQSTTGEPLEPPLVPDAACRKKQLHSMSTGITWHQGNNRSNTSSADH